MTVRWVFVLRDKEKCVPDPSSRHVSVDGSVIGMRYRLPRGLAGALGTR